MARGRKHTARHGRGSETGPSNDRWLLTYADMITLLLALFIVLFSISVVNVAKYKTLQRALRAAFSGQVLPGAKPGATGVSSHPPARAGVPAQENSQFAHLEQQLDAYAGKHGFSGAVRSSIEARGLVISVLSDRLLFASGSAMLDPGAYPLIEEIAGLVNIDRAHPIAVEGDTDDVPIHSSQFPSNWELSTARASTVVRFLIADGVAPQRLTAAGFADERPIATNATAAGRAHNRRVEIVLQRADGSQVAP